MAHKIFVLVLFLLSIPSYTRVQSTEEGLIFAEIFDKGIDFAKDLLINTALSYLIPLELPPIEKPVKIPLVGTVHISLSNIVLYSVNVSSSTVKPGDSGIAIVVSGAKAYLDMDWSYHYGTWLVPEISDKGIAAVEVKGMEVGLTLMLKNKQGTLELSLLDCGCHVNGISIKLDGGASWLYQGLVNAFEKNIRSSVEDAITQKIEDAIVELDNLLQSLPKEVAIDDVAVLNITFVNDLVFSNSSIGLEIDGLFTAREEVLAFDSSVRNSRASVSCEGSTKMAGLSIHEDVLNSASLVYFNAGVMHWIVDKIPHQSLLNTAEWRHVIPQLYKQYPNDDMSLNLTITSPPIIRIARQNVGTVIYADVTIDVSDAGEVIPVACISMVFSLSGFPEISRNKLGGSIRLDDFTMSLKWSTIGKIHMLILQPLIQTLLETLLVPYVNLLLWNGLPLPEVQGYTLDSAQVGYAGPRIILCSDVALVRQHNLNPLVAY